MDLQPFNPHYGSTVSAAVTATAADLVVKASSRQVMLTVVGTQIVFVRATREDGAAVATVADVPVLPNTQVLITKPNAIDGPGSGYTRLSVVAPGGAGSTIYATSGNGLT